MKAHHIQPESTAKLSKVNKISEKNAKLFSFNDVKINDDNADEENYQTRNVKNQTFSMQSSQFFDPQENRKYYD